MTVRRRRGIPRRVGTIFVEVWRLFKARLFYPRGPDVSRLATIISASADAGWRLFKARFFYPRGPDVSRLATITSASADAGWRLFKARLSRSRGPGAHRVDRAMFRCGRASGHREGSQMCNIWERSKMTVR